MNMKIGYDPVTESKMPTRATVAAGLLGKAVSRSPGTRVPYVKYLYSNQPTVQILELLGLRLAQKRVGAQFQLAAMVMVAVLTRRWRTR